MNNKNKKALGIGLGALAVIGLCIGLSKMRGGGGSGPTCSATQYWNGAACVDLPIDPGDPLVCEPGYHPNEANTACVADAVDSDWAIESIARTANSITLGIKAPVTPAYVKSYAPEVLTDASLARVFNVQFAFGHIVDSSEYTDDYWDSASGISNKGGLYPQLAAQPLAHINEVMKFGDKVFVPEKCMVNGNHRYVGEPGNEAVYWNLVYGYTGGIYIYWSRLIRIITAGDYISSPLSVDTSVQIPNPITTTFAQINVPEGYLGYYDGPPIPQLDVAVVIYEELGDPTEESGITNTHLAGGGGFGTLVMRAYSLLPA